MLVIFPCIITLSICDIKSENVSIKGEVPISPNTPFSDSCNVIFILPPLCNVIMTSGFSSFFVSDFVSSFIPFSCCSFFVSSKNFFDFIVYSSGSLLTR